MPVPFSMGRTDSLPDTLLAPFIPSTAGRRLPPSAPGSVLREPLRIGRAAGISRSGHGATRLLDPARRVGVGGAIHGQLPYPDRPWIPSATAHRSQRARGPMAADSDGRAGRAGRAGPPRPPRALDHPRRAIAAEALWYFTKHFFPGELLRVSIIERSSSNPRRKFDKWCL